MYAPAMANWFGGASTMKGPADDPYAVSVETVLDT